MKIDAPKRISAEFYPDEYQQLIELLGQSLNPFMDQIMMAISGRLNISDNLHAKFQTFKVTVDASGIPSKEVGFQNTLNTKVAGFSVIRAVNLANIAGSFTTTHPFISFTETDKLVKVHRICGLPANTEFQITAIMYGL